MTEKLQRENVLAVMKQNVSEMKEAKRLLSLHIQLQEQAIRNFESQEKISEEIAKLGSPPDVAKIIDRAMTAMLALSRGLLPHELEAVSMSKVEQPASPQRRMGSRRVAQVSVETGGGSPPPDPTPASRPARITRQAGRKVGMNPYARRLLRTAVSDNNIPESLEDVAHLTWGDEWDTFEVPATGTGRGKITKLPIREDLQREDKSSVRASLRAGITRLIAIRDGELKPENVDPALLELFDQINSANRWTDLEKAVREWGITL
jgi:hypothetical protein